MAITSNTYTGNGTNKLFSITFPYIDTTDVDVYLNGVLQTVTTQYTFANATTIEFVAAPGNGVTVVLRRSTQKENLNATFFPGSSIKAADLNENFDQLLYISQENTDVVNNLPVTVTMLRWKKTATAGQTVLTGNDDNAISLTYTAGFEQVYLNGAHLTRNADYTASDGATITMSVALLVGDLVEVMAYAPTTTASINSTAVPFTQGGAGAVTRNVDSKLKEVVSVKDFGAVGDGVADDTAAIQAAVNAHRGVFIPNGTYNISTAIVLTAGYSCLIGDKEMPVLRIPAANGPAIKITATGSTYNEFSCVENLILYCIGKPSFSSTPNSTNCGLAIDGSTASVAAAVQRAAVKDCRIIGFSCGINLASTVNTLLERIYIEQHTNWSAETGYTASNLYVGVNFNLTPYTVGGISPQASCEVVQVVVNGNGNPSASTSQCFRIVGQDPRDIFFDRCETAGGNYGWYIQPTSNDYNLDLHIRRPIIDAVKDYGIYILNWGGYGALSIDGGYVVKNLNNNGAAIWIENSEGVSVQGVQVLGPTLNDTQDDGIRIKDSKSVGITSNLIVNCNYGVSLQNSANCTVNGNIISANIGAFEPTPTLNNGIRLFSAATKNTISANIIKGASASYKYSSGIIISSGCTLNSISANSIDSATVTALYTISDTNNFIATFDTIQGNQLFLKSINAQQVYQGNDGSYPHQFKDGGSNNIAGITNAGSLVANSDQRLKTEIINLDYGLNEILQLNPKVYKLLSEIEIAEDLNTECPNRLGLIAQEVQPLMPELVSSFGVDGTLGLDYTSLIPVLIQAIKDLNSKIQ